MSADSYAATKQLSAWKTKLFERWYDIRVLAFEAAAKPILDITEAVPINVVLDLAGLSPDSVEVQVYIGVIDDRDNIVSGYAQTLQFQSLNEHQQAVYHGEVQFQLSGHQGMSLRILPNHPYLANAFEPRLIRWA
jgi:starch phosphorylase